MYRKIMNFLEEWKESAHRKPLILQGARQVGKTYSVLAFGRKAYENVAYFNFETHPGLNKTFEEKMSWNLESVKRFHFLREIWTLFQTAFAVWGKDYE